MEQAGVQAASTNATMMEALDLCTSIHPRHGVRPPLERFFPLFFGKDAVYAAPNDEAADMSCQCFRDLSANMPGVVNCQGNGNYPSYQKSNGKEWCVNEQRMEGVQCCGCFKEMLPRLRKASSATSGAPRVTLSSSANLGLKTPATHAKMK